MLTAEGKNYIKRYLAGWAPSIAQSMTVGIGQRGETPTDARLHLEVLRVPLTFTTYDFATNKLVFKTTIPDNYTGKIYEMGLYSLSNDPNEFGSRFITTFDSNTEDWVNPVDGVESNYTSVAARIGIDALNHSPVASSSVTSSLSGTQLDLSSFSSTDSFTFAFSCADANTSQIVYKFMTDASNYYSFSMGAQTAGYKIVESPKGSATITGSPNWSNITEIQTVTTAKSSGTAVVEHDAIRLEDKDYNNLDYILVARKVLATPFTKIEGQTMDLEFTMDITI